jgi:hypothetical protein
MLLELKQLKIKPGQQLLLDDVSWQQFENILTDLGEHRSTRVSYSHGYLEIMVPLPEHEKAKEIIGDIIKILLDRLNSDYDSLGSTTFKSEKMTQRVEPDACFYIQNQALVLGKNRLDMNIDPPYDATGSLVLLPEEAAQQRAESETQRAESERLRAERLAARLRELGEDPELL